MPVPGLTPRRIRDAKPKKKPYFIWDRKPKGLGLVVTPTGHKSLVVYTYRNGGRQFETLGEADRMPLKEARALARKRISEFAARQQPGPDTPFEIVAELVMRRMELLWKPSTFSSNRCHLERSITPYFEGRTLPSITRMDVEKWFAGLHNKPGGANRAVPLLSVIMREAEEMGLRPEGSNPVHGLRRYRRPKKERVLTADEMARLGAALVRRKEADPLKAAFVLLVVLTGCRVGEIRDLQWKEYRDGKLHLIDSKTGPKTVFLCSHARAVLDGIETKRTGPVFPSFWKGRSTGFHIQPFWTSLRRETGLEDVRMHDLRHTYASVAIRMGESLSTIGTLLGHSDPESTLRYAHLDDGMMRDAVERVSGSMATKTEEEKQ